MTSNSVESRTLPSWLEMPPRSVMKPPVTSLVQDLPFEELDWADFEKLCLRLARAESEIELCRLYGAQGDGQEGIDLFARARGDDRFRVYQCKRVKDFGPAKIRDAVRKFLDGEWRSRARSFYLCTTESLRTQVRTDELLLQTEALKAEGITLEPWDSEALSLLLKSNASLVLEFFGRQWVERFNGMEALQALSRRLDRNQTAQLRHGLAKFYSSVFASHDPTYRFVDPIDGAADATLVLPDVVQSRETLVGGSPSDEQTAKPDERGLDARPAQRDAAAARRIEQDRFSAAAWVSRGRSLLITGGPGSGKSTLLRVITLDLLSQSPRLGEVAAAWGTYLPIWVPFARWTTLLAERKAGNVSLLQLLKDWFALHDADELFLLVTEALEDDRLLLLIDGLDEWHTPDAGRIAWSLLESFLLRKGVPAIACARPQAADVLGTIRWESGALAPLTDEQQERVVLDVLSREAPENGSEGVLRATTRECLADLRSRVDLMAIARSPMILVLLVHLWHRESDLPSNRFAAFRRMAEVLVATQPERRRKAAAVHREGLPTGQLLQALCALALHIVEMHPAGAIQRDAAARALEVFLADEEQGLALSKPLARRQASEIVEYATDSAGLLVRYSSTEVAFLHRALLERLAAEALTLRTALERREFVLRHARNPQMSEVILGLGAVLSSREDVQSIVDAIDEATNADAYDRLRALPLLYELALTAPACPPRTAKAVAERALTAIETERFVAPRRALVELSVRGLRIGPVQEMTKQYLGRWFPRRLRYRRAFYDAVARWPSHAHAEPLLLRGLHEEDVGEVRAAAGSLVALGDPDNVRRARLLSLASTSPVPAIRAALLDAFLGRGADIAPDVVKEVVGDAPRLELRFVEIHARVLAGEVRDDDRKWLLASAAWNVALDREWRRLIPELLSRGWPADETVRDTCLRAFRQPRVMDLDLARATLARTHLHDPGVALAFAQQLEKYRAAYDDDVWPHLVQSRPHSQSVNEVMRRLLQKEFDVVTVHWAALVLRDEDAKHVLIDRLRRGWPHWAARALLAGWGLGDTDVHRALTELALEDSPIGAAIAHLLPEIIADRGECRTRLLQLLEQQPKRADFVVQGLAAIREATPEPEIVAAIIRALSKIDRGHSREDLVAVLVANWADDREVEALALAECDRPEGNASALALAGKHSAKVRDALVARVGVVPKWVRTTLAKELGGTAQEDASSMLAAYAHESDGEVRAQGAVSWCRHIVKSEQHRAEAARQFHLELQALGLMMDEARVAAFCGLMALDALDIFLDAKEPNAGKDAATSEPLSLRTDVMLRNPVFWRTVAAHWDLLQRKLGPALFARVLGGDTEGDHRWESLAAAADPRSSLADTIVDRVLAKPNLGAGPEVLRLLQRDGRAQVQLRDSCLAALAANSNDPMLLERALVGARILGESFVADDYVAARLAEAIQSPLDPSYAIIALCEGWQRSPLFERVAAEVDVGARDVPDYVRAALVATVGAVDVFLEEAVGGFRFAARPAEFQTVTRLIIRRLRADERAYELATAELARCSNEEWVRLVTLMSRARPLDAAIRERARRMVAEELEGVPPLVLLDPMSLEARTAGSILMDTLW